MVKSCAKDQTADLKCSWWTEHSVSQLLRLPGLGGRVAAAAPLLQAAMLAGGGPGTIGGSLAGSCKTHTKRIPDPIVSCAARRWLQLARREVGRATAACRRLRLPPKQRRASIGRSMVKYGLQAPSFMGAPPPPQRAACRCRQAPCCAAIADSLRQCCRDSTAHVQRCITQVCPGSCRCHMPRRHGGAGRGCCGGHCTAGLLTLLLILLCAPSCRAGFKFDGQLRDGTRDNSKAPVRVLVTCYSSNRSALALITTVASTQRAKFGAGVSGSEHELFAAGAAGSCGGPHIGSLVCTMSGLQGTTSSSSWGTAQMATRTAGMTWITTAATGLSAWLGTHSSHRSALAATTRLL